MAAKGVLTAARARGLAVALLVNAALLALLAIGPQTRLHLQPEAPSPVILLDVFRPPRPTTVEPKRPPETKPEHQARPSAPPKPLPPVQAAPTVAAPVAQAPPAPGLPSAPAVPAGPAGQGAVSDKGAAAVRHLLGCAAFSAGRRHDGDDCGIRPNAEAGYIDALSPERRLDLGPTSAERREELHATSQELQSQTFAPRGNAARFGCNQKGGKWKCSTY